MVTNTKVQQYFNYHDSFIKFFTVDHYYLRDDECLVVRRRRRLQPRSAGRGGVLQTEPKTSDIKTINIQESLKTFWSTIANKIKSFDLPCLPSSWRLWTTIPRRPRLRSDPSWFGQWGPLWRMILPLEM